MANFHAEKDRSWDYLPKDYWELGTENEEQADDYLNVSMNPSLIHPTLSWEKIRQCMIERGFFTYQGFAKESTKEYGFIHDLFHADGVYANKHGRSLMKRVVEHHLREGKVN